MALTILVPAQPLVGCCVTDALESDFVDDEGVIELTPGPFRFRMPIDYPLTKPAQFEHEVQVPESGRIPIGVFLRLCAEDYRRVYATVRDEDWQQLGAHLPDPPEGRKRIRFLNREPCPGAANPYGIEMHGIEDLVFELVEVYTVTDRPAKSTSGYRREPGVYVEFCIGS